MHYREARINEKSAILLPNYYHKKAKTPETRINTGSQRFYRLFPSLVAGELSIDDAMIYQKIYDKEDFFTQIPCDERKLFFK